MKHKQGALRNARPQREIRDTYDAQPSYEKRRYAFTDSLMPAGTPLSPAAS